MCGVSYGYSTCRLQPRQVFFTAQGARPRVLPRFGSRATLLRVKWERVAVE